MLILGEIETVRRGWSFDTCQRCCKFVLISMLTLYSTRTSCSLNTIYIQKDHIVKQESVQVLAGLIVNSEFVFDCYAVLLNTTDRTLERNNASYINL